jgi:hypothetical protein
VADRRKKEHRRKPGKRSQPGGAAPRAGSAVTARKAKDAEGWELVHPRCAREREDDLEEVSLMLEEGETEIAIDELRWLLSGCSDFIEGHKLLGMLALSEFNDLRLARGHFGYAYQCGVKALRQAKAAGPLPYQLPANQSFYEAGKGLAHCLRELGKITMAREVLDQLLKLDPADPLGLAALRATLEGRLDAAVEEADGDEVEESENDV